MERATPARIIAAIRRWARPEIGELVVLALWTLIVARPYFNWNPEVIPLGHDLMLTTLSNRLWDHARDCGSCALWNGDIRGGAPAFVDTLGAPLHPIVIVTTLLW